MSEKIIYPKIPIKEQVDILADWCSRYPTVDIHAVNAIEILKRDFPSDDHDGKLEKELEQMRLYNRHIMNAKSRDYVTTEMEEKLKEGNVKGVWGNPTNIENLSREYGLSLKEINYIIFKYVSMDSFFEALKSGKVDKNDGVIGSSLRCVFDMDSAFAQNKAFEMS